jgi:hypothetical protein
MKQCKHVLSEKLKRTISEQQQNKCIYCNNWIFISEVDKLIWSDI